MLSAVRSAHVLESLSARNNQAKIIEINLSSSAGQMVIEILPVNSNSHTFFIRISSSIGLCFLFFFEEAMYVVHIHN